MDFSHLATYLCIKVIGNFGTRKGIKCWWIESKLAIFANSNVKIICYDSCNHRSKKETSNEVREMHDEDVMLMM